MRIIYLASVLVISNILLSCGNITRDNEQALVGSITADSLLFSFVFTGCNRVNRHDQHHHSSTANVPVLKRLLTAIDSQNPKPELFFFLGDIVYGEGSTHKLSSELRDWVALYEDPAFNPMLSSGIEMVAVPGNHEMLTYKDGAEYPLEGSIDVWMQYMAPYLPADRVRVDQDSSVNQATFTFVRHNTAFIVMNTDTYNNSPPPNGTEGIIPETWITGKVQEYRADPNIDHIFILGHKPCYVDGNFETGHGGLPEGPALWPVLMKSRVAAMLSAHQHYYDRAQPYDSATYQIIAGNAGSSRYGDSTPPPFFGYTLINVMASGSLVLKSIGFSPGKNYNDPPPAGPTTVRDSTVLTWTANGNRYTR